MKIIQFAVFVSLFISLNASPNVNAKKGRTQFHPHPRHRAHGCAPLRHAPIQAMSEAELKGMLDGLEKEEYSIRKIGNIRRFVMNGKRSHISDELQAKFCNIIQDVYKNHNKENRRESLFLRNVLNFALQGALLDDKNKEEVRKIAGEIGKNFGDAQRERTLVNLNNLHTIQAKDDFRAKVCNLYNIIGKRGLTENIDKNAQGEVSSAIHDLYSQRSSANPEQLTLLRNLLKMAQTTPLLSTISQYEVKEIMLPEVIKNLDKATMLAEKSKEQSVEKKVEDTNPSAGKVSRA